MNELEIFIKENNLGIIAPIEAYDGYYVSNRGYIVSNKREPIILKQFVTNRGYATVNLHKEGKAKRFTIHRLVAFAFLKDSYFEDAVINHIDENQLNNNVENLEWVTQKENLNKAQDNRQVQENGRTWGGVSYGENNGMSKVTEQDVLEIRELYNTGLYTHQEIADMYGLSKTNAGDIIRRKIWKTV